MKEFEIDGEVYVISWEEYYRLQAQMFADEFGIPYEKAKSIINDLWLEDLLEERYDQEIGDIVEREAKNLRGCC